MGLPEHFIERYKDEAEESLMYGEKVKDLSRDELLATIGFLWERLKLSNESTGVYEHDERDK